MGVEDYFDFLWFHEDEEQAGEDGPNDLDLAIHREGQARLASVNERWAAWKRAQEDAYAATLRCACGRPRCGGGSYCEHARRTP